MKKPSKFLLFFVITLSANMTYAGEPYIGLKAGQFEVDIDDNTHKHTAYGVYGGYQFNPNVGIELEYTASKRKVDTTVYGGFGTLRYHLGDTGLYAKGKLGWVKAENTVEIQSIIATGLGLGFVISPNLNVEAEYAFNGTNADSMTLGAHLKF